MFDSDAVLPILAVLAYLTMLAVVVVRRKFSRSEYCLLETYLVVVILWILTYLLPSYVQSGHLERLLIAGCMVLMPALFCGVVLAALYRRPGLWWWAVSGIVLASVILLEIAYAFDPLWIRLPHVDVLPLLVMGVWVSFMFVALGLVLNAYFLAHRPAQRIQLSYLLVATLLTVLADGLYFAQGFTFGSFGLILKIIGSVAITYYLAARYLPDWRFVIRRTARCLLLMILSFLVLSASVLAVQFLSKPGVQTPWLSIALASVVFGVVYIPVYSAVRQLGSRFTMGREDTPTYQMRDYSHTIANILSAEELALVAIGTIVESLEISRGALLVVSQEMAGDIRLRPIKVLGAIPDRDGILAADSPLLELFWKERTLFTGEDLLRLLNLKEVPAEERRWLDELDMCLFVPVAKRKGNPLGFFVTGPKCSGAPFLIDDFELLMTLAAQTGVALENVRLVEDLRRLNEEISTLNAELQRTNRALTHRDKTKFDFIQIASHELKTPLTLVRGYADMLNSLGTEELMNTEFIKEATSGIVSSTSRMAEMIDAMLDVARLDAEALALHLASVSTESIVNRAIAELMPTITQRNLHVTAEGMETLPEIKADGQRLYQALLHVLSNALKYTPDGGDIFIKGQLLENHPSAPFVQLVVRDSGIGINPEERELIFETFYRADDPALHSTSKTRFKGGGPGLGLTIVKGIIESHRGRVWVESKYQSEQELPGTSFFILLPLDPEQSRVTLDGTRRLSPLAGSR